MQTLPKQSSPIVEFDDEQSLSLELSDIEEFAMDNHEISIKYDYGVELIHNYRKVNFLKSKNQQLSLLPPKTVSFYV